MSNTNHSIRKVFQANHFWLIHFFFFCWFSPCQCYAAEIRAKIFCYLNGKINITVFEIEIETMWIINAEFIEKRQWNLNKIQIICNVNGLSAFTYWTCVNILLMLHCFRSTVKYPGEIRDKWKLCENVAIFVFRWCRWTTPSIDLDNKHSKNLAKTIWIII